MNFMPFVLGAALCTAPIAAMSSSVSLDVNGTWTPFYFSIDNTLRSGTTFDNKDGQWLNVGPVSDVVSFDFTLKSKGWLRVTDLFVDRDQFEVFANDASLGFTTRPGNTGTDVGPDFDAAFANPNISSGQWLLEAGTYSVTGRVSLQLGNEGAGAISVSAVPIPQSILFLLSGGLGLLAVSAKRRKA